ncbi:OLC1v1023506C1 [Oldenlandia corymbosa var. corymbosa]|uniref:1,3-beta-glucan synthase n=1 Tax=Oldenlandia corymbosa var. corymbosa TaxID=529605 RepID=A0AAV1C036_OLDCO|nr:OLC1v1023506C1 [Oldenlandia corymbosa var. corymbosa]
MASSSGTKNQDVEVRGPQRQLSRTFTRLPTYLDPNDVDGRVADSEMVPSALAPIAPILRVANEIEEDNPKIAYLCRFHAFEKAHRMDPNSTGRGVRQFKTYLLRKLERDEVATGATATDPREVLRYYKNYYEKNIKEGQYTKKPEDMAKILQIAAVLYDMLMTVIPPGKIDQETRRYAEDVQEKREQYKHYNILPLYAIGVKPAIMELPEIKAAHRALQNVENLPVIRLPENKYKSINDILEWLYLVFGFQKGNVANQREHLILLLANMDIRDRDEEHYDLLDDITVQKLLDKIFKNYQSWCKYLHRTHNLLFPRGANKQQLQLLYISLYLLIWGEASNIRFMPECICYIFHNMANEVHGILFSDTHTVTGGSYQVASRAEGHFLQEVITPLYEVLRKEAMRNKKGKASHAQWRNYDDLNEYFWSGKCFKLGWPMDKSSDFFVHSDYKQSENVAYQGGNNVTAGRRKPKTNFVEIRTFWHLYRSFDRLWIFFILALQAMIIIAWHEDGSLAAIFDPDVFRSVLSIFITGAVLNFLRATLDIALSLNAWRSLKFNQILRYLLKFAMAAFWVVLMPVAYSRSVDNPTGLVRFFSSLGGSWLHQSLYNYCVVLYLIPNILAVILFLVPYLRKTLERSNSFIFIALMWWAQPKLYVGRGMHEDMFSLLRYTLFWILLLISKLAFSYYVEILPLVGPTKIIMALRVGNYEWHEFFPNVTHNIGVVIAIWVPIILVYLMDTQIWYAIFSTIVGGISGAFSHLGEIRTLGMLRSRFGSIPRAFNLWLVPSTREEFKQRRKDLPLDPRSVAKFSQMWNEFILSMRMEDLISNSERDMLLVPYSASDISVIQWPPFLLASKIPIAIDMAQDHKGKDDVDLFKKITNDPFMESAVIECYETLTFILYNLVRDKDDQQIITDICTEVKVSIEQGRFLNEFRMSGLVSLSEKFQKLLSHLISDYEDVVNHRSQVVNVIQDIMEIITHDIMNNGHEILKRVPLGPQSDRKEQRFENINFELTENRSWREKAVRLHLLLNVKESAINVPTDLDARRRITFFANSLFMKMPPAPKVRNMLSFSVLTPYYNEDVLYSEDKLNEENEDGITILFYLQKIYPDQWKNFEQRMKDPNFGYSEKDRTDLIREWVSYRGQTLSRTVRGMMYYRHALELQCFLDSAKDREIFAGYRSRDNDVQRKLRRDSKALADMKFTYVVSCQIYGAQKKSSVSEQRSHYVNILSLLLTYPSLRVAYIDEVEDSNSDGKSTKSYYSVLVKGGNKLDEEIYRIKLPGPPAVIGEGKPENQNHAIIFTRGEALQTIDMNQDNYFEEAFKMRNTLEEFLQYHHGRRTPTILGLREHIFTGSVSSLAGFMSNQETSFVTIGQRVLASPLRVRFHYGHPDIFDRIFHITRGGISKASKTINLSEDIFAGYNSTLRGGYVTHHEYIQVGKGRDVGMNPISLFEAKVANGNGEQTLSRDVYRLGRRFDFFRMLSFYFTTVGFYFSSMVTVLVVYMFLYGRLYMVLSGMERRILEDPTVRQSKGLEEALATQSVFQLGLLLVLPMIMEIGLERGFRTALGDFIIMQLQLASVFFTFHLGTKAHYYGRTLLHGGSKYRATGRGFVVRHEKFAENYRMYSRSHFVKGLELFMLLLIYQIYGRGYRSSNLYLFITFSMWFLTASWLFAPFVFNPSGFDWQKTVDDWTDWKRWLGNRGGIAISPDKSWESWWDGEQEHLKHTNKLGRLLEVVLAFRFFIYQYGIVYHLDVSHGIKNIGVYGLSWFVMAVVLAVLKMVSVGRRRFGTDFQLMFRILKALLFLGFVSVMTVLFVVAGLTVRDIFAAILAFTPSGWAILLIAQAMRPFLKGIGFWDSIMELARAYECLMGIVIFAPVAVLSWFPFVSEFQTRLLFNQAFSRGLQISMILAGKKDKSSTS